MESTFHFFTRIRWILLSIIVLLLGFRAVSQAVLPSEMTDFTVYRAAGEALRLGQDPYSIVTPRGWHFISPLATAVLFAPLAALNVGLASALWFLLNVVLLGGTIWLALDGLGLHPPSVPRRVWCVPLILLAGPIIVTLSRGQWSIVIAFLLTLGWWCSVRMRDFWSGFCFGFAAALKLVPLIFAPWLLLRRRWPALLGFAAAVLVGVVVMPGIFVKWQRIPSLDREWEQLVVHPSIAGERSAVYDELLKPSLKRNQSIPAVASRLHLVTTATYGVEGILALAAAIVLFRKSSQRVASREAAEIGIVSCVMLFVSPVSWSHYYSMLLLPLILVTAAAAEVIPSPLSPRTARNVLIAVLALAIIHEASSAAQVYGALLVAGIIVFGFCWTWAWRDARLPRLVESYSNVVTMERSDQRDAGVIRRNHGG